MYSFNRLFNRNVAATRVVAKNRLQQVLAHDRAGLSPAKINHLKDEIVRDGVDLALTVSKRKKRGTDCTYSYIVRAVHK